MMSELSKPPWYGTATGRNEGGRFATGNSIARGNPIARKIHHVRTLLYDSESDEVILEQWNALKKDSLAGEPASRRIYWEIMAGRIQQVELTGEVDGDPIKIDMANLTTVIMTALGDHPEARHAVAAAIYSIGRTKPEGTASDGPGSGNGDSA